MHLYPSISLLSLYPSIILDPENVNWYAFIHYGHHKHIIVLFYMLILVGKPLVYKNYRTDQRFRRVQSKIHNFLERPRGWKAASYHLAVFVFNRIHNVLILTRLFLLDNHTLYLPVLW